MIFSHVGIPNFHVLRVHFDMISMDVHCLPPYYSLVNFYPAPPLQIITARSNFKTSCVIRNITGIVQTHKNQWKYKKIRGQGENRVLFPLPTVSLFPKPTLKLLVGTQPNQFGPVGK